VASDAAEKGKEKKLNRGHEGTENVETERRDAAGDSAQLQGKQAAGRKDDRKVERTPERCGGLFCHEVLQDIEKASQRISILPSHSLAPALTPHYCY